MTDEWIPDDEWRTIVANVPIVSVDLLIRTNDGLLFGKRTNEPAKGYWFPPGGRVQKSETRKDAVHRVAREECGLDVEIVESLGAFEHLYETAATAGIEEKHYLANGYVVDVTGGEVHHDAQHESLQTFQSLPEPLHKYVRAYLTTAETLPAWS